jgi:hypothetical protein
LVVAVESADEGGGAGVELGGEDFGPALICPARDGGVTGVVPALWLPSFPTVAHPTRRSALTAIPIRARVVTDQRTGFSPLT